jgi:hypothetical protein
MARIFMRKKTRRDRIKVIEGEQKPGTVGWETEVDLSFMDPDCEFLTLVFPNETQYIVAVDRLLGAIKEAKEDAARNAKMLSVLVEPNH